MDALSHSDNMYPIFTAEFGIVVGKWSPKSVAIKTRDNLELAHELLDSLTRGADV
jgi:hypothetical protein